MNNSAPSAIMRLLFSAANKLAIKYDPIDEKKQIYIFRKEDKELFVKGYQIGLNSHLSSEICKNKIITKKILIKHKIKTPQCWVCQNGKEALNNLINKTMPFPLVVKPIDGSEGKAVTSAIYNYKWFKVAVKEVKKYLKKNRKPGTTAFIVEKYIQGEDYRFLILNNKVISVINRKPAYIDGDGKSNIRLLIESYNQQKEVGKGQIHCPILYDYELQHHLKIQEINLRTIPPKGKRIYLRKNANVSTGGRAFEINNTINQKYKELAVEIAKIFHLHFCSVDMIISDPSNLDTYSVIEINSQPGFDINEKPYKGKGVPVSKLVLESFFKTAPAGN